LEAAQQEAHERRLLLEEQKLRKLAGSSATPCIHTATPLMASLRQLHILP